MAKKRTRQSHSGSVYQSRGIWFAAVMLQGKRRRVRCASRAEANLKRQELCQLAVANSSLQSSTFGAFRTRWLDHIQANLATKTDESYRYAIDHFDSLDSIPLERITGLSIQAIVDKLSGKTRQAAFDKCKQMLEMAIRWKCLASNPMEHLDRPAHEKEPIDPFDVSEVEAIVADLQDTRYGAAVHLAFACGLRGGELWGLKWVDLKGNELNIQRQACETSGTIEVKPPKTTSGIRRILLPDSVLEAMAVRRADSMKEGNAGVEWMFPGETGKITRRSNFGYRVWAKCLKRLEIRQRGLHHARHTAATMMLNLGCVPLAVVSRILGHKSPKITLETYSHVMTTDQTKHRNALDSVCKFRTS